jgi:L-2,4-diaminobutyric acid acetyltransferase
MNSDIVIRPPNEKDAIEIWRLIETSDRLDHNSHYCYLLLTKHFRNTCALAELNGELFGFQSGYILPDSPATLFLWQVVVKAEMRGQGIASRLIVNILERLRSRYPVKFIEATITPSNDASQALFRSLAKKLGAECNIIKGFLPKDLLPAELKSHESEDLWRIGPIGDL